MVYFNLFMHSHVNGCIFLFSSYIAYISILFEKIVEITVIVELFEIIVVCCVTLNVFMGYIFYYVFAEVILSILLGIRA